MGGRRRSAAGDGGPAGLSGPLGAFRALVRVILRAPRRIIRMSREAALQPAVGSGVASTALYHPLLCSVEHGFFAAFVALLQDNTAV